MTPKVENNPSCAICKMTNDLKACSACGLVYYCNSEHQKEHWKEHKTECIAYKIIDDKNSIYIEAARDIKAGSVVLSENPLVIGPDWSYDLFDTASTLNCVGCFEPIRVLNHRCQKCSWPCCNVACIGLENNKLHEIECAFLKCGVGVKKQGDYGAIRDYYRTDVLLALKCLLLQIKSKKKFEQLMKLNGNVKERKGGDDFRRAEKHIDYLEENFLKPLKEAEEKSGKILLPQKDRKTLQKIYGIIDRNAVYLTEKNEIAGLYSLGSTVTHSCVPNSHFIYDRKNAFKLTVKAIRDIKKGEIITTCFGNILFGTQARKHQLAITKFITCNCIRCNDPTELGTNFSSLKCIGVDDGEECGGIQVPKVNKETNDLEWLCDKCPARVSGAEISDLMTKMDEEIDNTLSTEATVPAIENLMGKLAHFLHPNHFHLFTLKHALVQLYGNHRDYPFESMTVENLKRKIKYCDELLEAIEKLDPKCVRLSFYMAVVLYEKCNGIRELMNRRANGNNYSKTDGLKLLKKAQMTIKYELDSMQGKNLNENINDAIDVWQKIEN
ncbi:hypothetical protein PVAND_014827 [Polypedilum vanderplanki]|uniref:Protein msta n=1 Tax=Polypedilum vanderplanki TaxID=319348 RepID=A0A9J6BAC5_POLVA|nr:hypothetical protein PVAND_014827 [Polypedilum vanderplanki]